MQTLRNSGASCHSAVEHEAPVSPASAWDSDPPLAAASPGAAIEFRLPMAASCCTVADGFDGRSLRPTNAERQCNKPVLRRTSRLPSPPVRLTGDQSLTRRAVSTCWAPVANGGDRR